MALMQLTIMPLGTENPSLGKYVTAIQQALALEDIPFELNDMGTLIEGDTSTLLELAARMHEIPFADGVQRVVTQISIDDRRDRAVGIGDKTASIRHRLGLNK